MQDLTEKRVEGEMGKQGGGGGVFMGSCEIESKKWKEPVIDYWAQSSPPVLAHAFALIAPRLYNDLSDLRHPSAWIMFKSNLKMHLCPLIFCAVGVFMCRSSVGAFFCLYCKTPYTYTHTHVGLLVSTILILVHAALTRPYLIQLLCPEVASYSFQFTSGVPPSFLFL